MPSTDQQGPHEALADLTPIVPAIWTALERGTEAARSYFGDMEARIESFLFSNLVRFHAGREFDAQRPAAVDDENRLRRHPLANNGLLLTYRSYRIRIFKAGRDGNLRPPGSWTLQAFYEQLTLFNDPADKMNLVVIWQPQANGVLDAVKLVCPRDGSVMRSTVSVHWMLDLPHPAETISVDGLVEVPDDAVLDIPIERIDASDA